MLEDVVEVVSALTGVTPVLLVPAGAPRQGLAALTWPGTVVLEVPVPGADPGGSAALAAVLDTLAAPEAPAGAPADAPVEVVVVAPDAPDLPPLLLGKLFRGLGHAEVAVCPAADGSLVALGTRLPAPGWVRAAGAGLDSGDALARLAAAAPRRAALHVGPGWHRLRRPADVALLDAGLEGWEATRAALPAVHRRGAPPDG